MEELKCPNCGVDLKEVLQAVNVAVPTPEVAPENVATPAQEEAPVVSEAPAVDAPANTDGENS